tara:strand:+ start:4322 stop:4723 length:402 start_codon:yes stop_codon:yes gene_type:complete
LSSIFRKIINGETPSFKVAEDNNHIAILDINPNSKGHTLCIPKKETDKIFDLPLDEYLLLMDFSHKVGNALAKTVKCKRIGISVIGLEVPHIHVHLIPLSKMEEATFTTKVKFTDKEMKNIAAKINSNFKKIS